MRKLFTVLQGVESTPLPAKTPDITKAQVGGWLQFAVSTAVALTLVSPAEAEVLIGASGIIAFGIHISDAIIRKGRAGAIAALTIAQADQGSTMGSTAPGEGEELPPAPTLDGAPEVDVSLDGTGTTPPPDAEEAEEEPEPVEAAPAPAQGPPAPVGPPQPTAEEIQEARRAVNEAQATLDALLARSTTPQA
jgi:hypothetical protein